MKPEDLHTLALAALTAPTFKPTATAELLAAKVDRLGALHAAIAQLRAEADDIRTELEAAALAEIDGHQYRVTFSTSTRDTVNWQAIAKRLKASPQLIRAYTTTSEPTTAMRVTARKTH